MGYQHILLIDDDEDDQEIFLEAVSDASKSVTCTVLSDATQALQKLINQEISPDVIFLDLNMPVMDGPQFLAAIKKSDGLQRIPVIIFSTSSHPGAIQITKDSGAADFITKPGNYYELVTILTRLLI